MNKFVVLLMCLCFVGYAQTWETYSAPSTNDDRLIHATVYDPDGDKIYMIGGTPDGYASTGVNYIYAYDPVANSWNTSLTPMPTARSWISGAYWNGKIYVIGGSNTSGTAIGNNEVYDIAGNSWATPTPISQPRFAHGTVAHNGNIYVVGGTNGTTGYSTVYRYNISGGSWSQATDLPQAWDMGGCTIWDNVIYICGGYDRNAVQTWTHLWGGTINPGDPDDITWTQLDTMPGLTGNNGATALDGNIYMLGGFLETSRSPRLDFYRWNLTWVRSTDYPITITRNYMVTARLSYNQIYGVAGDANGDWGTPNNYYYKIDNPTGIEENPHTQDIKTNLLSVHPSIGNKTFTISFSLSRPSTVSLTLHNVVGQKVMSLFDSRITLSNHIIKLSSEELPPGIYFINLRTDQTTMTQKLVVTR